MKSQFHGSFFLHYLVHKLLLLNFFFRNSYLKMSHQCGLLELMSQRIIRRLLFGKMKRYVMESVKKARNIISRRQNCFQKTVIVRRCPGRGCYHSDLRQLSMLKEVEHTCRTVERQFLLVSGHTMSNQTILNKLHQDGHCTLRLMVCFY